MALVLYKTISAKITQNIEKWLNETIRPTLTPDVSKYAQGRLRAWLNVEPNLYPPFAVNPGIEVSGGIWSRLQTLLEWPFDFCLATYSGDENPIGIGPHRDAGYADFEACSLNVSGQCKFEYWKERWYTHKAKPITPINPNDPPTDMKILLPGQVHLFNCKNLHAATPGTKRWCLNFWKKKAKQS